VLAFKRIQGLKIFSKRKREERTTSGSGALRAGTPGRTKGGKKFSQKKSRKFKKFSPDFF